MGYVVFNASLYLGALIIYWNKRRKIDVGFVLFAIYAAISIAGVFLYLSYPNAWKVQLWSFIYLFVIVLLFFRPLFFDSDTLYKRLRVRNKTALKVFAVIYVIAALISIYYSVDQTVENIKSGDWAVLRRALYSDDIALYTNQLERWAKIFVMYLRPMAIVLLFYYMTLKKTKKIWLIIFALAIITPAFFTAINTASRGLVLNLVILFFLGYIIFRKNLSKEIKKIFIVFVVIFLVLFLIYSLAVTLSRFGEQNQSTSLLNYFGQSMLVFNYGLTDSIQNYGYGKYFFNWFLPFFGVSPLNTSLLGAHFGTSFFTFVGAWYIDFGPVGTFIIAIILPMIIGFRTKYKRKLDIADIFLFLFYVNYLAMGVFVIGRGNALPWLMTFFLYGIFKLIK